MQRSVSKRQSARQRWLEHINAWQDSDLTQKAFCQTHQLGYASFRRWRGIFKAEEAKAAKPSRDSVRFLPVKLQETIPTPLTIHLQEDLRIEVAADINPQLLQQVIEALRSS